MANFDSAFDKMIRNEGGPLEPSVRLRRVNDVYTGTVDGWVSRLPPKASTSWR